MVPLAQRQAVCFGIMSYNGQVNFGLIGDYDAMGDLDLVAQGIRDSIDELRAAAVPTKRKGRRPARRRLRSAPGERVERPARGRTLPPARAKPHARPPAIRCSRESLSSWTTPARRILYPRPYRATCPRAENSRQVLGNPRPRKD